MTGTIEGTGQPRGTAGAFRRIVTHPLVLLPIGVVLVALGAILAGIAVNALPIDRASPLRALSGLLVGLCGLLVYFGFQRWIVGEPRGAVRPGRAGAELAAGVFGGIVLFSLVVGAVALLGGLSVAGIGGTGEVWVWLGIAFYSGMVEEAVFRGVIQRQLEAMFGTWAALALTSAFFGLAHLMNPGASWFAAFAIACEAGILLGAAYLVTRRLWAPIGFHMGWNFTQGWIWSIPVSGGKAPDGLIETRLSGPELLTGGAFGLEASGVALVVATIAGVALLRHAYRKGEFMPPRWKRQTNE